ncbi:nuclear transport factor 2 family protein [Shewanella sp. 125m-7]
MNFKLENLLVELELYLQKPEVRSSRAELERLISDDFTEFSATGCSFGKDEILARLPDERVPMIEASQFAIRELSEDICQVTYRAKLKKADDNVISFSIRSSIWRKHQDLWQLAFHQGTQCRPF